MINFFKKKNEMAKESFLQALNALDVMPEMWKARNCSFKTDIRVDVDDKELQLHICRTVKGRDADISRSPLAYRCHGIKAMPAKDFLLLLFLNCSEVYGHRRPLDGTDTDLIKFYYKAGFFIFFIKKIKKSTKIHYSFPKFPHTECIQKNNKKGDKNMSTTLLERFRKNVETKKGESEFLDASIEFLDDIEKEIKEGIDAGKVLTKEEKKELSEFYDYFTKTYLNDNSCFELDLYSHYDEEPPVLQLMEEMFDDALLIERDAYIDFMPDDERARADDLVEKLLKIDGDLSVNLVFGDECVFSFYVDKDDPNFSKRKTADCRSGDMPDSEANLLYACGKMFHDHGILIVSQVDAIDGTFTMFAIECNDGETYVGVPKEKLKEIVTMFNGEEPDTDEKLTDADAFLDCGMQLNKADELSERNGAGKVIQMPVR